MTREEAIDIIENKIQIDVRFCTKEEVEQYQEALTMAITALRPISREQVERVWRGCNECTSCKLCIWNETKKCNGCKNMYSFKPLSDFCPRCGKPLTDEAVEMVMERWKEALDDETQ